MIKKSEPEEAAPSPEAVRLVPIIEALLFASPEPLTTASLRKVFGEEVPLEDIKAALALLEEQTAVDGRGISLVPVAGGYQFLTREEHFPFVQKVAKTRQEEKLTPASIETLAVIAYKQPVTRAEVDAVRGVASGPIVRTLMDRGLVRVTGRAQLPGSPFQYGTTKRFLKHFGLKSTRDLPDPKELPRMLAERSA